MLPNHNFRHDGWHLGNQCGVARRSHEGAPHGGCFLTRIRAAASAFIVGFTVTPTAAVAQACVDDSAKLMQYVRDFAQPIDVNSCSGVASLCADLWYGPLLKETCPNTCAACKPVVDQIIDASSSIFCVDRDKALGFAYTNCSYASSDCDHPTYGAFVRQNCPVACGVCGIVEMNISIGNISYSHLMTRPTVLIDFVAAINHEVLLPLPAGMTPEHAKLAVSQGSRAVNVNVEIAVPRNLSIHDIELSILTDVDSGMDTRLARSILGVTNITQAMVGASIYVLDIQLLSSSGPILPPEMLDEAQDVIIVAASNDSCVDDDEGLAVWASTARLLLRGCLDVVAGAQSNLLDGMSSSASDSLTLFPSGYCYHKLFGLSIRRYCPLTCHVCSSLPVPVLSEPLLDLPELHQSVPWYDLETSVASSLATCSAQHWASASDAIAREYYMVQLSGPMYGFAQCQEKCAETPGGRLLSCIEDADKFKLLKQTVLKDVAGAWIGLLQPSPSAEDEPIGSWSWTSRCLGYQGFWFAGSSTGAPRQPDNHVHEMYHSAAQVVENCAAILNGYMNASHEGFDIPCEWYGRSDDVKHWLPDRCVCETALRAAEKVPMCTACRAPYFPQESACKYEVSNCSGIEPGSSCEIRCRPPFQGSGSIIATCPSGNHNLFRLLQYDRELECSCPEPPVKAGYMKVNNKFVCAGGYTGMAQVRCPCGQSSQLYGCELKQHCAMPAVDKCRQDASDCEAPEKRYAGSSCIIRCRSDQAQYTRATCPDDNTDASRHLDYNPLRCTLDTCEDPVDHTGYNKTADGWTCDNDHFGTVEYECMPNQTGWIFPTCAAVGVLSGCQKIVNCGPPALPLEDDCKIDVSGCQSVPPGGSCELKCRFPFEGIKKLGSCPEGNIDPLGLSLNESLPACTVITEECDKIEPDDVPAAYTKLLTGWTCSTSYTGVAEKTCVPNLGTCDLSPVLSGCSQLKPCEYQSDDCRYNAYDCVKVQPGSTCQIGCKPPYAGTTVTASCSSTNNDKNGLNLFEGLPDCIVTGCSDPWPWPQGYRRIDSGWECDDNYTDGGLGVTKTCVPAGAGGCTATSSLSGCQKEVNCVPLTMDDACWLDVSQCGSVSPGERCTLPCRTGWQGIPGYAVCPAGNVDPTMQLLPSPPDCECEEPYPVPPEYFWSKDLKAWRCASGYAGQAFKRCLPGPNCTTIPTLVGCYAPVPCEVAPWEDDGSTSKYVAGTLRFGPAKVGEEIDESEVMSYRVFFANVECERLGESIAEVDTAVEEYTCCKDNVYMLPISAPLASGATRLVIVAVTAKGEAPDAGIIELEDILGMLQDRVQFRFTVLGLDFVASQGLPATRHNLEVAVKQAVADEAGTGVDPAHVETSLAPGSIMVDVIITPPFGIDAADVQYKLGQNVMALSTALRDALQDVVGIDQVATGPITIRSLTSPTVLRAGPAPAVGQAPHSAQPIHWWSSWVRCDMGLTLALLALYFL
mmetsp:Transcript_56583/g.143179  ORF Transcript_56583/g.143179 Transcript_56583/m.143179 type:complete len:1480 (+) Transcript_56583:21-4460(+)